MAKIVITADWHFGYPGRLNDSVWAFKQIIKYCIKNNINKIFNLGDMTHNREYMTHDVSCALAESLQLMQRAGIEMLTFPGNHDMYQRFSWEINALKMFKDSINLVNDVGRFEYADRTFWTVPFIEHEDIYMKVINKINEEANEEDILLTHIGVNKAIYNACFLMPNWNIVDFEDTKFDRVYAGHFHCHQKVGSKMWYPGSPLSFRFDEGLVNHGFMVFDSESNTHEFIDVYDTSGYRPSDFVTAVSEDLDDVLDLADNNNVRIILNEGDDKEAIRKTLEEKGAKKVTFTKPKEDKVKIDKRAINRNNLFESWIEYDSPEHLSHKLLVKLEADIRSKVKVEDEDDTD